MHDFFCLFRLRVPHVYDTRNAVKKRGQSYFQTIFKSFHFYQPKKLTDNSTGDLHNDDDGGDENENLFDENFLRENKLPISTNSSLQSSISPDQNENLKLNENIIQPDNNNVLHSRFYSFLTVLIMGDREDGDVLEFKRKQKNSLFNILLLILFIFLMFFYLLLLWKIYGDEVREKDVGEKQMKKGILESKIIWDMKKTINEKIQSELNNYERSVDRLKISVLENVWRSVFEMNNEVYSMQIKMNEENSKLNELKETISERIRDLPPHLRLNTIKKMVDEEVDKYVENHPDYFTFPDFSFSNFDLINKPNLASINAGASIGRKVIPDFLLPSSSSIFSTSKTKNFNYSYIHQYDYTSVYFSSSSSFPSSDVSLPYDVYAGKLITRLRIFLKTLSWKNPGVEKPEVMLNSSLSMGSCYPIKGSFGYVDIDLSKSEKVEAVSIGHVSTVQTLDPTSAPKDFEAWCVRAWEKDKNSDENGDYVEVDDFQITKGKYDLNGYPYQTFHSINNPEKSPYCSRVKFLFHSNHGNNKYTCIYHLLVHPF